MITIEKLKNWFNEIDQDYNLNNYAHISFLNAQELEAHDESTLVTLYINFKPYPYDNLSEEERDDRYNEFQEHLQNFFTDLANKVYKELREIEDMDFSRGDNQPNHFHVNLYQEFTHRDPQYCGTYNQILSDESIIITYVGFTL